MTTRFMVRSLTCAPPKETSTLMPALADVLRCPRPVRFTPEGGRLPDDCCPLCADGGHGRRDKSSATLPRKKRRWLSPLAA